MKNDKDYVARPLGQELGQCQHPTSLPCVSSKHRDYFFPSTIHSPDTPSLKILWSGSLGDHCAPGSCAYFPVLPPPNQSFQPWSMPSVSLLAYSLLLPLMIPRSVFLLPLCVPSLMAFVASAVLRSGQVFPDLRTQAGCYGELRAVWSHPEGPPAES